MITRLKTRTLVSVVGLGLALLSGCGDDTGLGKRYPVTGQVTYNGKPLESGKIAFIPVDPEKQRTASGFIQDGNYTLTTAIPDDGALPGDYQVTVTALEVDTSKVNATVAKYGGGGRQHEIAASTKKAKDLVPAKYKLGETSA